MHPTIQELVNTHGHSEQLLAQLQDAIRDTRYFTEDRIAALKKYDSLVGVKGEYTLEYLRETVEAWS